MNLKGNARGIYKGHNGHDSNQTTQAIYINHKSLHQGLVSLGFIVLATNHHSNLRDIIRKNYKAGSTLPTMRGMDMDTSRLFVVSLVCIPSSTQ
jgi:hypothetical protein